MGRDDEILNCTYRTLEKGDLVVASAHNMDSLFGDRISRHMQAFPAMIVAIPERDVPTWRFGMADRTISLILSSGASILLSIAPGRTLEILRRTEAT